METGSREVMMTTANVVTDGTPIEDGGGVRLADLGKRYDSASHPALDQLNLDVNPGHFVALLGPSGCGKTTTLRIVAGLLDPSAGTVTVDGNDITTTPVHKRDLGMVFQSYALFPHMTVGKNVEFGLEMQKVPKPERQKRASAALDLVHLGHLSNRRTGQLSGGQQQRIALARALVIEPRVLLLDEPLSNLDAKLRESMRNEIRKLQQRLDITTLFVTHDQDEALFMADRVAVMNEGRLEQYGSPSDIYERPSNRFVANFVGRANILPVTLGKSVGTDVDGTTYQYLSSLLGRGGAKGPSGLEREAGLVVRPHRIRLDDPDSHPEDKAGDTPKVSGQVSFVGYTGDSVSIEVESHEGQRISAEIPTGGSRIPETGDNVRLSWADDETYLIPMAD